MGGNRLQENSKLKLARLESDDLRTTASHPELIREGELPGLVTQSRFEKEQASDHSNQSDHDRRPIMGIPNRLGL